LPDLWRQYLVQCDLINSKIDIGLLERKDIASLIVAETTRFAMYNLWFCTNDAGEIWRPENDDFEFVRGIHSRTLHYWVESKLKPLADNLPTDDWDLLNPNVDDNPPSWEWYLDAILKRPSSLDDRQRYLPAFKHLGEIIHGGYGNNYPASTRLVLTEPLKFLLISPWPTKVFLPHLPEGVSIEIKGYMRHIVCENEDAKKITIEVFNHSKQSIQDYLRPPDGWPSEGPIGKEFFEYHLEHSPMIRTFEQFKSEYDEIQELGGTASVEVFTREEMIFNRSFQPVGESAGITIQTVRKIPYPAFLERDGRTWALYRINDVHGATDYFLHDHDVSGELFGLDDNVYKIENELRRYFIRMLMEDPAVMKKEHVNGLPFNSYSSYQVLPGLAQRLISVYGINTNYRSGRGIVYRVPLAFADNFENMCVKLRWKLEGV